MRTHRPQPDGTSETGLARRVLAPAWQTWLETIGLVAVLLVIGALLDRRDPFLLSQGFPWLTLAPLLAGLQYGAIRGMACGAVQAAALAIASKSGLTPVPDSIAEIVLGWLIAGLVAGEFRDFWQRRTCQLESSADRLRARVEGLSRAYLALKISHDRLQRGVPGRPASLRDALAAFRRELGDRSGGASIESVARRILELFSENAFVRAATLHPVDPSGRPGPAVASLGGATGAEDDPLVREAAQYGLTTSIRDLGEGALVLAAVPLVDLHGRARAVVAVRDMPFVALHAETLELLAMLGGRIGDFISAPPSPPPSLRKREIAPSPDALVRASPALPAPARVEEAA